MKIAFFIGSVDISGGTYVIYQHALYAKRAGHEVTVVVLYPYDSSQMQWHPACKELHFIPLNEAAGKHFDLAIATWWKTATELHAIDADRYAYFVQSIESRFYPEIEAPLRGLVNRTYDLGLPTITEATWIKEHLYSIHNNDPFLARNGIRKDIYSPVGTTINSDRSRLRVLVEGPFGVSFKNVGTSLRLARQSKAASTWLLTSTNMRSWYPGVQQVFSRVPIGKVSEIYRSCDVLLKLSTVEGMFGPPLEMFHCGGTAIVYDVSGHDEYIRDGVNGIVIKSGDEKSVIGAINALAEDGFLLSTLRKGALETAEAWPDWNQSSRLFLSFLDAIAFSSTPSQEELAARNHASLAIYVREENERLATLPPAKMPSVIQRLLQRNRLTRGALKQLSLVRESY